MASRDHGSSTVAAPEANSRITSRVAAFDILRGITIISMVCFHAAYDAVYIYGFDLPWFRDPVIQDVWRCSISWVFIALAGWMTRFSRNNLRRAALYGASALIVWLVTSVASVDTAISFGILYCMAACTLCWGTLSPALKRVHPLLGLLIALGLFALTYTVPRHLYAVDGLAWLGFPGPGFASGDYYPLIPYCFLYAAGAFGARLFDRLSPGGYPAWMRRDWIAPLSAIGRHSLLIYLAHQPLLIVLFTLIGHA
ncbi:heparan-alpha-glucosaminide N-acetyltransferase [[Collinsella] massiliensis]|uniref:heparan-alpha-glucosaminide N-acetyltransferase n=1 Tax=[Collinsella] massiliensis TaxID=1232426 RepID=UPI001F147562|nr:heparan-alpha-glucosaminide N-acetyltransferase [[Collinsella] massiliensis]